MHSPIGSEYMSHVYQWHATIFLQATSLSKKKDFRHAKGTNIFKNVGRGQTAKEKRWKGRARVEGWWVHDRCNIDALLPFHE